MKGVMIGPGGVLENIIGIMGYDNLCMKIYEDPQLVSDIVENVGKRLVRYYEIAAEHDVIGAAWGNDDWGFNTQTMLSPKHMREYVFPWHKKIVEAVHSRGKPCILHSCGRADEVMDDIVDDIKYDGRHSYEDIIMPVEDFYEKYHSRIAVIGGIDVDFITRRTPAEIKERSKKMLERVASRGGYALGTGNSVPEYIPVDNYLAMLEAAYELDN
jgi:uroporphyrinogen decarboxylase